MISPMTTARPQQRYEHRLRQLVQRTGDLTIATDLSVPRMSTGILCEVDASTPHQDIYILRCLTIMKQDALQGALDLLVLKILSRKGPLHGYAIMAAIEEASERVLRAEEGSLYPALRRMEESGWLRGKWITREAGRRARVYELTAIGKKQLLAEESRWQAGASAVKRVLRMA
jgi:transcriptional regulator